MRAHDLKPGLEIAAGVIKGKLGQARVIQADPQKVVLELKLGCPPPERWPLELIVAVPRPQTIKKILQLSALTGVKRLHFVKTDKVVKSYLQSKTLLAENVELELLKGMEQARDSFPPEVCIHMNVSRLLTAIQSAATSAAAVLSAALQLPALLFAADTQASPAGAQLAGVALQHPAQPVFLAVGPEAGWTGAELQQLFDFGFQSVSLGARILRVETAAALLLGQVALLREQARGGQRDL